MSRHALRLASRSVERQALTEARGYNFALLLGLGGEGHRIETLAWLLEAKALRRESGRAA